MKEFIALDSLHGLPDVDRLKEFLEHPETTFLSKELDETMLDKLDGKTPRFIEKSAKEFFFSELEENDSGIVVGGKVMVLLISLNPPHQVEIQVEKTDDLIKTLWDPIRIKVFVGAEEVGSVRGNILKIDHGVDDGKIYPSLALQKRTRDSERKNRLYPFLWIPHEKPACVYSEYIEYIGGELSFIDDQKEMMLIKPAYFKEFKSLQFAIGVSLKDFIANNKMTTRIYAKRNPVICEELNFDHRIHFSAGKTYPKDIILNSKFFVDELL